MPYCNVQDVEAYFYGKTIDCDSWLSFNEVNSMISGESQYMNAILRSKYTLPITNNNDLEFLKMMNERLVVGIIDGMDKVEDKGEDGFSRTRNLRKEVKEWLNQIKKGVMRLESSAKGSNIKFNNIDSNGNTVEKRFKDSFAQPVSKVLDRERRTIVVVS